MSALSPPVLSSFFTIFVIVLFAGYAKRKSLRPLNLPPGPKGLPFFGSVFQINASEPWLTFTQWASTYGLCHDAYSENYDGHGYGSLSRQPDVLHSFWTTDSRHSGYGRCQSPS